MLRFALDLVPCTSTLYLVYYFGGSGDIIEFWTLTKTFFRFFPPTLHPTHCLHGRRPPTTHTSVRFSLVVNPQHIYSIYLLPVDALHGPC